MCKLAIVVIGYNRVNSIKRLLTSLQKANYFESVDLIISIDNSGSDTVEKYVGSVEWPFGNKIVKTFPEKLGLRKNVLSCGNYMNEYGYDAIFVLEDDIVVSPGFFNFAVQAVEKYKNNDNIAGISLYSHSWNLTADRPFIPLFRGYDVFFMQYPQSWGQVWMRNQWNAFYQWYNNEEYKKIDKRVIPDNVLNWPESSWLKYHVMYCIAEKKYFVYPFHALSTNFADAGTHYAFDTNKMQIPMDMSSNTKYRMPNNISETSIYTSTYENEQLNLVLGYDKNELEVDLYGTLKKYKPGAHYLLSTKPKPFRVLKTFGMEMRPWEMNVMYDVPGDRIYLYDMTNKGKVPKIRHYSLSHWIYDTRGEVILKRNIIDILWSEIYNKIRYLLKN